MEKMYDVIVVGGTIHWGATFVGPGVSRVTSNLKHKHENDLTFFTVGEVDGRVTPRIEKIAGILSRMGKSLVSTTLMDARWRKLAYNCCGSGLSTVCGCSYSGFLDNPRAMECLSFVGYEIGLCAKADGRDLDEHLEKALPDPQQCRQLFYRVYSRAPEGKASMLQDLEAGRTTEVDMLNGYICAMGDKYGIDTPITMPLSASFTGWKRENCPFRWTICAISRKLNIDLKSNLRNVVRLTGCHSDQAKRVEESVIPLVGSGFLDSPSTLLRVARNDTDLTPLRKYFFAASASISR